MTPVITGALLRWYRKNKRPLPWRRSRDPYRVWVSEIMLQQTQIATVIPYYERFLKRFPTVQALARAPLQDVLKRWEGLGYYARARNLHAAAKLIRRWPRTAAEWRELPGVGEYTAAAIASICFDEPAPVWDGNVRRVVARLLGKEATMPSEWMSKDAPGDFNQAIMELGQTVCTPRNPACAECPVRKPCVAYKKGIVDRLPAVKKSKAVPELTIGIGVVRKNGRILIQQRAHDGMLGGLWEFPGGKRQAGEKMEQCVRREVREETGLRVDVGRRIAVVKHRYSHLAVELHAYDCAVKSGTLRPGARKWVKPAELRRFPFPAANVRIIQSL
jgi:A/G-specific adenine glycosylase